MSTNNAARTILAVGVILIVAAGARAQTPEGGNRLTMGSGTNETHVTASRADYDLTKNVLVLDGDVVVQDARVTIKADQIVLEMTTNREPKVITAVGHVVIEQELIPAATRPMVGLPKGVPMKGFRRAVCGRAVYGVSSGVTVLTEKPVITQDGMSLRGSRIIYSRDQDKVHIDNSSGIFVPSEGQGEVGSLLKPKNPAKPTP